ncbi:MAG TPA: DUF2877 domain-containing protein [Candidatus Limnocylindrales bacterium]|nr:DUF2877 domain-containing protein [Candidatus Limnocylindrales bacterium]
MSTRVDPVLARAARRAGPAGQTGRAGAVVGCVIAVHASAVNMRIGEALVTLARASVGGLPTGIGLDDGFAPRDAGIRTGDPVDVSGTIVRVGPLAIDLAGARQWSPLLPHRPIPVDLAERAAVLRSAVEPRGAGRAPLSAADRRRPTGPASSRGGIDDVLEIRIRRLRAAVRRGGGVAIARAGRSLVGLGAGLTPSGDDVLVGLSAAWAAIGVGAGARLAGEWSTWADGRTTDVALDFHRAAAGGAYAERLHDVLAAILAGPVDAIPAAAERAAAWGATSGRDTLRGVLIGLEGAAAASRPMAGAA